ncbi:MAG: aspartate-semialdehyde dehydrogenase, partial [Gemmatimonadetes bacterium]|nr:aspartate-semialdehyde dehydrogenase [Gemmatimonadota bacterium]
PVHVLTEPDAPQPRLHRDLGQGMAASVGRLRPCPLLDWKFTTLSHNTLRGAAGGSLLVAELAVARGLVPGS